MSNNYKKQEIRDLYYIIYNNRIDEGIRQDEAKRIALDAASLRFGITNDRVRHILYEKNLDNPGYRTFVYMNNQEIINSLSELISSYAGMVETLRKSVDMAPDKAGKEIIEKKIKIVEGKIEKYNQLIGVIKEVNGHYIKSKK